MFYLAMTRLKLKSPRYLIPFWLHTEQVVKQMRASEGFVTGKLMGTLNLSMWTMTLWTSEEALRAFYLSGAHQNVMGKLSEWSSEAVAGHLAVETHQLPSWFEVRTTLCKIGCFAKLAEPSIDHNNGAIENPKIIIFQAIFNSYH
jgi:Domain of unknown function (DUF3291)